MGYYINPEEGTKEEFLFEHGKMLTKEEFLNYTYDGDLIPVCLVDNGWMTAAAIGYSPEERDMFVTDDRPKSFYLVDKSFINENGGLVSKVENIMEW